MAIAYLGRCGGGESDRVRLTGKEKGEGGSMRPRGRRGCGPRANLLRVAGLEEAARRRDRDKRSTGPSDEDITPDLERVSYDLSSEVDTMS